MTRIALNRHPLIRRALVSRWPQLTAQWLLLAGFVLAIIAGLAGTPVGNRNFAIVGVWIAWWAALMLAAVPLFGRAWCGLCPLPLPGEWLQRGRILGPGAASGLGRGWRWPNLLRNIWLQNAFFVALALFSVVILTTPLVSALVLLAMIAAATALGLLFERRAFCRYVCPVGGFIGLYAQASPIEVRVADTRVCAAHREKTCYQGSAAGYGCPWQVYPGALQKNTYCGMCLECLRTCPYDNVLINLRLPGADLLESASPAAPRLAAPAPGRSSGRERGGALFSPLLPDAISLVSPSANSPSGQAAPLSPLSRDFVSARPGSFGVRAPNSPPSRNPARPVGRRLDEAYKAFIMLGSAVAYSAVLLGPWGGLKTAAYAVGTPAWLAYAAAFLVFVLLFLPGLFLACVALGQVASRADHPVNPLSRRRLLSLGGGGGGEGPAALRTRFIAQAYTLIPLGLAAWIAFSLGLALANGSYLWPVLSDPLGWGWDLLGTAAWKWSPYFTGALPGLQIGVVLAGLAWSAALARRGAEARQAAPVVVYQTLVAGGLLWLLAG